MDSLCKPCIEPEIIPNVDEEVELLPLCPVPEEPETIPLNINMPEFVREEIEIRNMDGIIEDFIASKRCRII